MGHFIWRHLKDLENVDKENMEMAVLKNLNNREKLWNA